MTKQTIFTLLLCTALCLSLAGCGKAASTVSAAPASSSATEAAPKSSSSSPASFVPKSSTLVSSGIETTGSRQATLYIGAAPDLFTEYQLNYDGDLTPELLIQGIADMTGWNLALADTVTTGKGGMTVCFAISGSLFVGPPEEQKDEFMAFCADQLSQEILDSIQKTLQMNFMGEGGNPAALDIYYCMEDDLPLQIPALGLSWPMDQPYQWKNVVSDNS